MPFYLRTGKFLPEKLSEVVVRFRSPPLTLFQKQCESPVYPNDLIIRVQPDEGISWRLNGKVPGGADEHQAGRARLPLQDDVQHRAARGVRAADLRRDGRRPDAVHPRRRSRSRVGGDRPDRAGLGRSRKPPRREYAPGTWGPKRRPRPHRTRRPPLAALGDGEAEPRGSSPSAATAERCWRSGTDSFSSTLSASSTSPLKSSSCWSDSLGAAAAGVILVPLRSGAGRCREHTFAAPVRTRSAATAARRSARSPARAGAAGRRRAGPPRPAAGARARRARTGRRAPAPPAPRPASRGSGLASDTSVVTAVHGPAAASISWRARWTAGSSKITSRCSRRR